MKDELGFLDSPGMDGDVNDRIAAFLAETVQQRHVDDQVTQTPVALREDQQPVRRYIHAGLDVGLGMHPSQQPREAFAHGVPGETNFFPRAFLQELARDARCCPLEKAVLGRIHAERPQLGRDDSEVENR